MENIFETLGAILKPDNLFVGTFPTCYGYSDTSKNFKEIGRVYFSPLRIEIFETGTEYKHAHDQMKRDFETLKLKKEVQISSTGQTAKITIN